jgi:hypothetical protein
VFRSGQYVAGGLMNFVIAVGLGMSVDEVAGHGGVGVGGYSSRKNCLVGSVLVHAAVGAAYFRSVPARGAVLGRGGAVLDRGVVVTAVAAAGCGLVLALLPFSGGAEALGGHSRDGRPEKCQQDEEERIAAEKRVHGVGWLG